MSAPKKRDMDERVSIPLAPEDALKALLATKPPPEDAPHKRKKRTRKKDQDG